MPNYHSQFSVFLVGFRFAIQAATGDLQNFGTT
jgi:hypothetical protein